MEVFVPQHNDERMNSRYPPYDDVEQMHRYYERYVYDRLICFTLFSILILEHPRLIFNIIQTNSSTYIKI